MIRTDIKHEIQQLVNEGKRPPGLAVILLGDDPASTVYVKNKIKACQEVGIFSIAHHLPENTKEDELLNLIHNLNSQHEIDGILVQLPLPKHIQTDIILESIDPSKDVDCFHPYNMGRLFQGKPLLRPCTPYGIIQLFEFYNIPLKGKHAVIVNASNIVGKPLAHELLLKKSTVTICHRDTQNLQQLVKEADLVIVAAGNKGAVQKSWLKKEHVIVDVGIHRNHLGQLSGDLYEVNTPLDVAWITPVPGGVGPMTIATLLQNTLMARKSN